ncbi:LamG-like jellyroll fold domain-containing protein [Nonomuraea africana]|uniref:LamG-like jellyroll fold domain-containing protein n=1 Tax=Nonomuraea africana TaxID=46171 RepID=UPI0033E28C1B
MLAATLTAAPAQGDTGLVAAYGMDEGSGNTVRDQSGNGHDGTVRDPLWVSGKIGKTLYFDHYDLDVDRTVVVPDAPGLRTSSAMTLEAWVRPPNNDSSCGVSKVFEDQDPSFKLGSNGWQVRIGGKAYGGALWLTPETWIHLAVVYDGTRLRILGDGYEGESVPVTGAVDFGSGPLVIGGDGYARCHEGRVDEVRLYRRALTDEEIQRDMVTAVAPDSRAAAPGGLTVDDSSGTARLSWEAATDDHGITGYEIHSSWNADFVPTDQTRVATVTGLTYTEGCVERGTYFYRVVALDTLPQPGHASEAVSAEITRPDCPPTAPDVTVQPRTGWAWLGLSGASDERGVTEVQVHRSKRPGFTPSAETLVAKLAPTVWRYADDVPASGNYFYRTVAVDTAAHVSEPSPAVEAYISAPPDLRSELVAAYGLNEGSGTTVANAKPDVYYPATVTNPFWVPGKHGKGLAFWAGSSVRVTDLPSFGNATIAAWVKPQQNGDDQRAIALWATETQTDLSLQAHNRFFDKPAATHGYELLTGPRALPTDKWVHLAATFDAGHQTLCFYIDGELRWCLPDDGGLWGTAQLGMGGEGRNSLNGTVIDEVRAYRAALTPQQIKTIMDTPIG